MLPDIVLVSLKEVKIPHSAERSLMAFRGTKQQMMVKRERSEIWGVSWLLLASLPRLQAGRWGTWCEVWGPEARMTRRGARALQTVRCVPVCLSSDTVLPLWNHPRKASLLLLVPLLQNFFHGFALFLVPRHRFRRRRAGGATGLPVCRDQRAHLQNWGEAATRHSVRSYFYILQT